MPIKAENRPRYPSDWAKLSRRAIECAGNRCERCGALNREVIWRGIARHRGTYMSEAGEVFDHDTGVRLARVHSANYGGRPVRIVLSVGHRDHHPEHSAPENLAVWCQRCHLVHDKPHHQAGAWETKRRHRAAAELFTEQAQP